MLICYYSIGCRKAPGVEMAKFQLGQGETELGSGMMAYKFQQWPIPKRTRGTLHVTNQRVCYYESWSNYVYMDLHLAETEGYKTKQVFLSPLFSFMEKMERSIFIPGFHPKRCRAGSIRLA